MALRKGQLQCTPVMPSWNLWITACVTGWLRISIWLVSSVMATSTEESESENVVSKATKQEKHRWLKTGTNWSGTPCSGTRLCSCVGVWVVMERGQKWEDDICPHRVKDDHSLTSIQASRFPLLCVLATSGAFPTAIISNNWHPYCNGDANSVIIQHTRRIWIAGYNSSRTWLENSVASRHSHTTWEVGPLCWMACSLHGTKKHVNFQNVMWSMKDTPTLVVNVTWILWHMLFTNFALHSPSRTNTPLTSKLSFWMKG